MSFQIHDNQGDAITMQELDRQACKLWNIEVDNRYYGSPYVGEKIVANWFDMIGWKIHYEKLTTWQAVKNSLKADYFNNRKELGEGLEGVKYMLEHLQPMFNLIYLWRDKGYKPVPWPRG